MTRVPTLYILCPMWSLLTILLFVSSVRSYETVQDAARIARALVYSESIGTLASVYPLDSPYAGQPFGLMEYYAPCHANGSLSFVYVSISQNARNINHSSNVNNTATFSIRSPPSSAAVTQPRLSLTGTVSVLGKDEPSVQACYTARHPDASWWVPGKGTLHDAKWARFDPTSIYYVGGFGGAHYIGYIPIELYRASGVDDSLLILQA